MTRSIREQFAEDGFTVVRGLLDASEVSFYVARLRELAGTAERWTQPDGVNRHPEFWPLIFNERLLKTVRRFHGQEYFIFLASGVENAHVQHHWPYYLGSRTDLGYSKVPAALADRLQIAGLLAHEPPDDLAIARAWIPSPTFVSVARRFK
jgi:hypothetical protein